MLLRDYLLFEVPERPNMENMRLAVFAGGVGSGLAICCAAERAGREVNA